MVNVDASVKECKGGLGVVFKNDIGNMVLLCATIKKLFLFVLIDELQALWHASMMAKDRDFLI